MYKNIDELFINLSKSNFRSKFKLKEKKLNKRNQILEKLEKDNLTKEERTSLEKELNQVIIALAKFK